LLLATLCRKACLARSLGRHQPHFGAGENQSEVLPNPQGARSAVGEFAAIAGPSAAKTVGSRGV
jgi:hypothetical protein